MKLYFVRHGESEANTRHIISNRVLPRYPLTAKGQQQAEALGQSLRGHVFAALYSSPILRALQTAERVAGQLSTAPEVRLAPALCEPDLGELEERGDDAAWRLHDDLYQRWWIEQEGFASTDLIGPAPCFFARQNGLHRWQILLRGPDPARLLFGKNLGEWRAAVDPVNLL